MAIIKNNKLNWIYSCAYLLFCFCFYAKAQKNILIFCSEGSPRILNPQLATDGISFDATKDVYSRLLDFDRKTSEIIHDLAVSWQSSEDGLSYTFQLRKGVVFHTTKKFKPTRELNADDVVFSFNRMLDKSHPYHRVNGGAYQYFSSMRLDVLIKKVVKIDDHQVRFELTEKNATFLISLAMQFAVIVSKEYADQLLNSKTPEMLDHHPVGTGPFILTDYKQDHLIRYKPHKKYFKKPAQLDGLVFSITPDPTVRFQKLKKEECHVMIFPLPSDYKAISKHKHLKLVKRNIFDLSYLAMNTNHPPLDKIEVRQAIRHALNRSLYIQAIFMGEAIIANSPISPNMWSYNPQIKSYEYSIEKAKKLLKSVGLEKGFEIDLWTLPISRPYNPSGKKMGELMKEDLAQVGINARLISYDWPSYIKKAKKGEHQLLQIGWLSDNGDPDNFLNHLLSCTSIQNESNFSQWCYPPYDQLVTKASHTLDKSKRAELYQKAQEIFGEQSPFAPLVHTHGFRGVNKKVQGYILAPFGSESFYGVSLKQ